MIVKVMIGLAALFSTILVVAATKPKTLAMSGGTTFHFVTDGIDNALARAREAADGKDIRLGGGIATIREYLRAGLVDEMHLAYAPYSLARENPYLELWICLPLDIR